MILAATLILLIVLIAIWFVRIIGYLRDRRRHRCVRHITAFVASPHEFDVERLLRIGYGVSTRTIAEAVADTADYLHPATEQRLTMVVKFYGVDFYLIERIKRCSEKRAMVLLSKIPVSRDAKRVLDSCDIKCDAQKQHHANLF